MTLTAPELRPALAGRRPPQDAAELRALAAHLSAAAERFTSAAHRLGTRTAGLAGDWGGPAAAAALVDLEVLQRRALDAADAHVEAAQVLRVCAARLDDAEATWQRAEAMERQDALERAARSTAAAAGAFVVPYEVDASPLRTQARRLAAQAQAQADDALARAAAQLRDLAERAPIAALARLTAADQLGGVGHGAVEAIWGSVVTIAGLSLPALLVDPDGARERARGVRDGASYALGHPREAGSAAIGWDLLQEGRYGEWAGGLAPDLLGAAFTGGGLPIARRGADLADDLDDLADDVGDLQRVHGRGLDSNAGGPVGRSLAGYVTRIRDLTPERRRHILDGDEHGNGGGHRHGTGRECKSEFPADWSDDDIIRRVMDTARNPDSVLWQSGRKTFVVTATHAGVLLTTIVNEHGAVVSGYPERGPGVRRNPCR